MILFDVITVGSNTLDAFVKTDTKLVKIHSPSKKDELCLAYPLGDKILINHLDFQVGGGGTNTAVSFSRQGLKTAYLGMIGKDINAELVKTCLKEEKIDFLGNFEGITGYSVVLDSKARDRTILTYKGCNNNFKFSKIQKQKLKTKWFYFSSMMSSSLDALKELARYASKNKVKLAFNPSQYSVVKGVSELKSILENTNILILNKKESELLTKKTNQKTIFQELKKYVKDYVIITNGEEGVICFDGKHTYSVSADKKIRVVETTGAGDAFSSGFTAGIIKNEGIASSLKRGMIQAEQIIQDYGAKRKLLKESAMKKLLNKDERKIVKRAI
ncbi:carbohydrate kinase family protein [Candidatus Woesearchaeota archaeon CG10_big_fil_rev_8_21_14_0_10_32_9]|nr:MAG: carbohydrate kinase family protein [Candidatus Woesearchaeota archaeon CG10_big_fil_rev_8_21_14_0_10_32_9]